MFRHDATRSRLAACTRRQTRYAEMTTPTTRPRRLLVGLHAKTPGTRAAIPRVESRRLEVALLEAAFALDRVDDRRFLVGPLDAHEARQRDAGR